MNTLRFIETIWQDLRYGFRLLRKQPDVRRRGDPDARARHRRERRDLPAGQSRASAHAARRTAGGAGLDRHRHERQRPDRTVHEPPAVLHRAAVAGDPRRAAGFLLGCSPGASRPGTSRPTASIGPRSGLYVSGDFFRGARRQRAGRPPARAMADDQKGCGTPGAVLSHGFWQSRYGGNPGAIGQTIMLDGRPFRSSASRRRDSSASRSAARSTSPSRSAPNR